LNVAHDLTTLYLAGVITAKERRVLELANRGLGDRSISLALGISRGAVRDRRKNAIRKIELHRNEAA